MLPLVLIMQGSDHDDHAGDVDDDDAGDDHDEDNDEPPLALMMQGSGLV